MGKLNLVNNAQQTDEEVKARYITEYIRSMKELEEAMEPYKEQKRELRQEYKENGWLSKEEISMAVKAYRLLKDETDLEQLMDFYETLRIAKEGA
jgi:flagellar biosynthesis/type III secretory pathway chaperone|tara:strand:- start:104 stop:388 length:285 start_codon:yes stop_codon:yes gene_type:complete